MHAKDWCFIITTIVVLGGGEHLYAQTSDGQSRERIPNDHQVALTSAVELAVETLHAEAAIPEPILDPEPAADEGFEDDELDALLDQDITSLRRESVAPALDMEVSTVSRQTSTVGRSPAAVFVISEEMIRRSGARTIPETLRMVPGLHVAHIDGSKWSISSRGFASRFANKLLVQIDGRTVYTPLFGGVFWDVQDLLLDDVKRIEVIRGPGGTIWGANAVNGVINIITKSAAETHGAYAHAGGGNVLQGFAGARLGNRTEKGVDWRVSGKWYDRDQFHDPQGRADDYSQQGRLSFRTDWTTKSCDQVTFQGDYYNGDNGLSHDRPVFGFALDEEELGGGNVLGRWTRVLSDDSDMSLQLYYDRTDRLLAGFDQDTNTIDIDFQHRFSPWQYHQVIWGLGYRNIWDRLKNTRNPAFVNVSQERRTLERISAFIQDEMTLIEDELYLTIGTKLSNNTYTDFEIQPSARFLWLPREDSVVWGAVSRAVRTPFRVSEDLVALGPALPSPPFPANTPTVVRGNRDMASEEVVAFELGFRRQVSEDFAWDAALFYNIYDELLSTRNVVPGAGFPFVDFFNGGEADTWGVEISALARMTDRWTLRGWYSYLNIDARLSPLSNTTPAETNDATPKNQAYLMSTWNPRCNIDIDLMARYADVIPFHNVPSYITMDLRYAWRPNRNLELAVVGQNLLDTYHPEYRGSRFTSEISTEVPRGVYGMFTLRY